MNIYRSFLNSILLLIVGTLLLYIVYEAKAEEYSNDFDFKMSEIYDNKITNSKIINENYNPFNLYEVIQRQREDKIIRSIYLKEKYQYTPLSPNKRQHRKMTKTNE